MSKGTQIIVGATAIALLVAWYVVTQVGGVASFRYYETLDEFRAAGSPGEPARVHGYVAQDSIERDVEGRQVFFRVQGSPPHAGDGGDGSERIDQLDVVFRSLEVPDLFKDGAEVVVEGRMDPAAGAFVADTVLAKCPSKFMADPDAARAASF